VREEELGLTPARLRGIREAAGEILVFVDDDNVLAADYLSVALQLMRGHPWIGALGGSTVGEFETPPESWWQGRLENLAILEVKHECWARLPGMNGIPLFTPCGAGMVIRRTAAAGWAEGVAKDPLRRGLGRRGTALTGYDDIDLVLFVCSLGLAIGRFPQLSLTHLIARARLEKSYFVKLTEGNATSFAIMDFIWEGRVPSLIGDKPRLCRSERVFRFYQTLRNRFRGQADKDTFEEELESAVLRGKAKALQIIQAWQNSKALKS